MSGYVDHAHRHRPEALGGTDPIDFPDGAKIITASFNSPLRSRSLTGGQFEIMDFHYWAGNDPSFDAMEVTGSGGSAKGKYISISEAGLYVVQASTFNDESTPFSGNDDPLIEVLIWFPGSSSFDILINTKSAMGWDDGQSPIYGEMLTTDEYAHQQMLQTVWFNATVDEFGELPVGIGVGLEVQNNITKTVGGSLVISRVGEPLVETELS